MAIMITHSTQSHVQQLLATSDFGAALDLIHSTRQALKHELTGLSCLKNIDVKLLEMVCELSLTSRLT
jgi:hypothetical protein